jgi:predicted PurR-regulated permease PerM
MTRNRTSIVFLLSLTALALALGLVIMRPFLKPILFALALAMVFHPLYTWVRKWFSGPNTAALISTTLVLLALIVPALVLGRAIASELRGLYQTLSEHGSDGANLSVRWLARSEHWINEAIQHAGFLNFDIRGTIRQHIGEGAGWILQQAASLLGNLTGALLGAVVTAVALFFIFREGAALRERVVSIVPLQADQVEHVFSGVHDVVVASVYGILAIGLLQGALVGIAFWVLDLSSPVFWGMVTAFLSLIPIVGTGAVWGPAAIILMAGGHWAKSLILVAWGISIVHPIDNVLRPYLVGQRARLSAIYLFFAILGGVKAFGLIGLLAGPVVLSVALVLLGILKTELPEWRSTRNVETPGAIGGESRLRVGGRNPSHSGSTGGREKRPLRPFSSFC